MFVAAVTRPGLWFMGEMTRGDTSGLALRADGITFLAGLGLASLILSLAPATAIVLRR